MRQKKEYETFVIILVGEGKSWVRTSYSERNQMWET